MKTDINKYKDDNIQNIYDIKTEEKAYIKEYGLTKDLIEKISREKEEPDWILDIRLKALDRYYKLDNPDWGPDISYLNIDNIATYVKSGNKEESKKEIRHLLINWSEYNAEDTIIFIGGGPDFLSNIVMPSIIELNKKIVEHTRRKTVVIVAKPFKYEGQKNNNSKICLRKLEEMKNNNIINKLVIIN